MADTSTIVLIFIVIVTFIMNIIAIIFALIGSKNLENELKKSIYIVSASALLVVSANLVAISFKAFKIEITNNIWIIVPILLTIAGVLFMMSGSTLMNLLKEVQEQSSKQLDTSNLKGMSKKT